MSSGRRLCGLFLPRRRRCGYGLDGQLLSLRSMLVARTRRMTMVVALRLAMSAVMAVAAPARATPFLSALRPIMFFG
jgi:hypothetical protein